MLGRNWSWLTWPGVVFAIAIGLGVYVILPDELERELNRGIVIKICHDGTRILRIDDGTYWARYSVRAYRVDNPETVCAL